MNKFERNSAKYSKGTEGGAQSQGKTKTLQISSDRIIGKFCRKNRVCMFSANNVRIFGVFDNFLVYNYSPKIWQVNFMLKSFHVSNI